MNTEFVSGPGPAPSQSGNGDSGISNGAASAPASVVEPQTFEDMGLLAEVKQALTEMGFAEPMPVQRAVFPRMMAGTDLLVQSRTGSGKTAAFGIPFAQGLIDGEEKRVQALILAPTRELALQSASECGKIATYRNIAVVPVYGGAPMGKQIDQLKAGAQVVSGTPGRVLDHLRRGTLKLEGLRVLVLDEADEMLSMGFLEEITEIIKRCPTDRQTLLFSATIPEDVERISRRYMRTPEKLSLSGDFVGAQEITHAYYMVSGMGRARDLVRVLEVERPDSAIIFCNTREDTSLVADFMRRAGLDAEAISSDLTQKDRERVMGRMKAKDLHYLVATDIAARGIDISDLSHVINYTFPESAEVYVHRTGRTGRAGKHGMAISLISPRELGNFYMLKLTYKIRPEERVLPSAEQAKTHREASFVDALRTQVGERAVTDEWRGIARRVWASEDGERLVAALIEERLKRPAAVAKASPNGASPNGASPNGASPHGASPTVHSNGAALAVTPDSAVPSVATVGAAPTTEEAAARPRRERRPRRAEGHSRPSAEPKSGDPAVVSGPAGWTEPVARDSAAESAMQQAANPAGLNGTHASAVSAAPASAPVPADGQEQPREKRRRGRRGGRARTRTDAPEKAGRQPETIDTSDGREFWEAWVDSKTESAQATAPVEAPPVAPSGREPRAPEPLAEGMVRLYLNLGRRDRAREPEVSGLLEERGLKAEELQVRNSHTYLVVPEERADAFCGALTGARYGERELVCERARK